MNRTLVVLSTLGIALGSTAWFLFVFATSPALGVFILLGGIIASTAFALAFLDETAQNTLQKSWDQLGREIEELQRYPATTNDKVRGLKELLAVLRQTPNQNSNWLLSLRANLQQIESLLSVGNVSKANTIAEQELAFAASLMVTPRVQAVKARLKAEAAADAEAAKVEFVTYKSTAL